MRVALVSLAACAANVAPAPIVHRAPAVCTIHEANLDGAAIHLERDGTAFARIDKLARIDIEVEGEVARARVETPEVVLAGELSLRHLSIRPIEPVLSEGWLAIRNAHALRAIDDTMSIEVEPPDGVIAYTPHHAPPSMIVHVRCGDLTLRPAPLVTEREDQVQFREGVRTPLRLAPGGEVVAYVVSPHSVSAEVLEHGLLWTKIRIGILAENRAQGWVPRGAVHPIRSGGQYPDFSDDPPDPAPSLACEQDVAVFFAGAPVGRIKAHARVRIADQDENGVWLDLGARNRPLARASDIADCEVK